MDFKSLLSQLDQLNEASTINGKEQKDTDLVWKQTSMSYEEAVKKYGKANVKLTKKGLRNGDDMVEVRTTLKEGIMDDPATKETPTGRVHTAKPGGYGRKDDEDDEGKKVKQDNTPRGRGRPKKGADETGEVKKYDWSAFGGPSADGKKKDIKLPKWDKSKTTKHSLKEYFNSLDKAMNEGGLNVQPIPAPKQTGQNFMIKDPSNPQAAAITTSDPAVVNAAKKGTLSMHKPGASPTTPSATPTTGAGSQVAPIEEEGGEKWIKGAIKHPGAFTAKAKSHGMTPAQFRAKVLANKEDYPAKTEKQAQLAKTLSKLKEVEAPQHFAQSSPISTGGRNPNRLEEGSKPDFLDLDKDGDKKEPMKKAAKEKTKVKEGMDHHLQAARLEGKSHALRKMPYNCTHDDIEESRMYHEGFKEGLDECYGQMPILGRTAVDEVSSEVGDMASFGAHTPTMEDELDEVSRGEWLKQQAHKPGDTFKAFGQTFHDKDVLEDNAFFESLDKQLNSLLESKEDVAEGMTVSISKGQQGAPDSVSVSAQDAEADQLLSIIKSAGMGLFGGEDKGFNAPEGSAGDHGGISVVDDHDGMMALMKKLSGSGDAMTTDGDYESEEGQAEEQPVTGSEEHSHDDGEDSCNECGMAYESCGCDHEGQEMVDEVQTPDQMTDAAYESNAPDSGAADTEADDASEAGEDKALAIADAGQDAEEGEEDAAEAGAEEVSEDSEEEDAEDSEEVEESIYESYANSADNTFEADIDFMTRVISGGLNKQKSTGQTTIPVIAGQKTRMGADGLGKPMKESTDLLKDYRKLSGL